MIEAFLIRLVLAIIALMILGLGQFFYLRFFDKLLDIEFKEAFNKIEQDPKAMAHYYGLRNLGASIAIGLIVFASFIL